MDIGYLRETRKKADLTQEEMAPLMQASRPTISKLENGERSLKADDLIRWLQVTSAQMSKNTTALEAGIAFVNGVDIVVLADMLTKFVGGFIKFL